MEPRISILMGIYNCASTLPEAIDSLYAQTYNNFNLILCDDGSTDNTYEIAERYAKKYNNIILLRNERNMKLAYTLNHCLKYANTEYIARMDGDDISLPERFEKQISFLDKHPEYAIVSCPMIHFDENGDWGYGKAIEIPDKNSFKKGTPHTHAPSMIRTSIMKEVGGYTDTKQTIRMEDYYLWYKIYKAGYKGYNLQEYLYKMRDGRDAIKRRKKSDRIRSLLLYLKITNSLRVVPSIKTIVGIIVKIILPNIVSGSIRKNLMQKN